MSTTASAATNTTSATNDVPTETNTTITITDATSTTAATSTAEKKSARPEKIPKGPNDAPDDAFLENDSFYKNNGGEKVFEVLREQLKKDGKLNASLSAASELHAPPNASNAANGSVGAAVAPLSIAGGDEDSTKTPNNTPAGSLSSNVAAVISPTLNHPGSPTILLSNKRVKMSSLLPALRQKSLRPLMIKTLRAAVMSFIYAAIGRLILGISKSLLKCGFSKSKFLRMATREVFSSNAFKWGTAAAGFSCYRLLQQLVLRISPHMPVSVSCAIGGGLASLPLNVFNVHTRTELGLYLAVRAIHGAICSEWNKIPMPDSWRKSKDWAVVYMVFLAVEILYTYSFFPETHTPAYVGFINSNTKQHGDTMYCLSALVRQHCSPYMMKMYKENKMNVVTEEFAQMAAEGVGGCVMKPGARVCNVHDMREACLFLHKYTRSCLYHFLNLSVRHFATVSVPLYVPLKVSTTLIFGFKKALRQPLQTIQKLVKSSLLSCGFLTLYACLPHLTLCTSANLQLHSPIGTCVLASVCGLATYLEPHTRRIDLALYCSLHGLRSLVNLLHIKGIIPKPTREWVFWLQVVAVGAMFYQYDLKYEHIHPNVLGAFGWLLKEKRRKPEDVAHALQWQAKQDAFKAVIVDGEYMNSSVVEIPHGIPSAASPLGVFHDSNSNSIASSAAAVAVAAVTAATGFPEEESVSELPSAPIPASGHIDGDDEEEKKAEDGYALEESADRKKGDGRHNNTPKGNRKPKSVGI